ncbi:MAG: hypothetical protein B7Z67_14095 [Acidiphilium sp. 21-60-14]|nr:MAG: hypothetical protein B7Z67_14095 [Acidiphilium sp. 21-60-14]
MAKNSKDGNRERAARRRAALAERGIRPIQVMAPEAAHPLIRQAANLMTRDDDPLEPRAALRRAGGANEPDPGEASPGLVAELEATKARLAEIESQAEARRILVVETAERRRRELEAERDAAVAAEVVMQEKAAAAEKAADDAWKALQRAQRTEVAIRRTKTMLGLRGRLVRWLARWSK